MDGDSPAHRVEARDAGVPSCTEEAVVCTLAAGGLKDWPRVNASEAGAVWNDSPGATGNPNWLTAAQSKYTDGLAGSHTARETANRVTSRPQSKELN